MVTPVTGGDAAGHYFLVIEAIDPMIPMTRTAHLPSAVLFALIFVPAALITALQAAHVIG